MMKHTRLRFFMITGLWAIIVFFVTGFARDLMKEYLVQFDDYLVAVYWIFTTIRTVTMIYFISVILYFVYQGYIYMTSRFYTESKIPYHEALFHGYLDLALAYQRLKPYGNECSYDTKMRSVIITFDHDVYHILVRDIFGKVQGEAKSDSWYIVSKKRKQYGNIRYLKQIPYRNPLFVNRDYINRLPKVDGVTYHNYVCLTGFRHNTFQDERINTIYEMEAILRQSRY